MTTTDPTTPPAASARRTDKLLALLSPRRRWPVLHAAQPSADHSPDGGPDVWLAGLRLGS
ncbi:hypothetical protein [Streptomyces phaeochromogenes]|uniref:hypothetical protein n=1 Tax=Streptomyces phaeochromogenes TaxID=1923 RepID=UPI003870201D|nr:hypothetical protein OG277_06005 [Streptomyces phaeochromogenes]